ncbi:MAG: T9SS type A sorting domain-containing protein [Gammaproteobacteria bacterium]|nr:T9SS type A sorting domain-containing protein [Gammaproteobacteria bacterium]NIW45456.1 T9SS type A sorting domain-containing protein [Gammaproteobacteria bacterium]
MEHGPAEETQQPDPEQAEILMLDVASPVMGEGHNDIVDDRANAGYLMIHNGEVEDPIDVTYNYWGGNPESRLYPLSFYEYEPWDETPNTGGGGLGKFNKLTGNQSGGAASQLLYQGIAAERQNDYTAAKTAYQQLIADYPDSMQTVYALPRLWVCARALNEDFTALQSFYANFLQNTVDSVRTRVLTNLIYRCEVQRARFNEAIVGYEAIVQDPPALADSVYALIDIGEIYLLQEELSGLSGQSKLSSNTATPSLTQLKPVNRQQFEQRKTELLSILFNKGASTGEENLPQYFALSQNYPNPFNPETTIKYQLPKPSKVKLEVFNILGQRVITLVNHLQSADYYTVQWKGINNGGVKVGSGLYIYRLTAEATDGGETFTKVKKMLLVR